MVKVLPRENLPTLCEMDDMFYAKVEQKGKISKNYRFQNWIYDIFDSG